MTGASDAGARVLPALRRIADQQGVGAEAVALAWLLAHPAGILPVMGTNTLSRIATLTDAFRVDLDRGAFRGEGIECCGVRWPGCSRRGCLHDVLGSGLAGGVRGVRPSRTLHLKWSPG